MDKPISRTQQALAWLDENPEASAYAAAKKFNLSESAISRALKRKRDPTIERCPTCGQVIRR
jgi:hypothetical protein